MSRRSEPRRAVYVRWEHIEHDEVKTVREPWVRTGEGCPHCRRQGTVYRPDPANAPRDGYRMCAHCSHVWEYNRDPAPATGIRVQMIRQLALAQGLA